MAEVDALLQERAEDLYEEAPCGYVSTLPGGEILKVNGTLLSWTGHRREDLIGTRFQQLLTPGGQIYFETHYLPLLQMQGSVREIALDLVCADGRRLPVLVNATLRKDGDGRPRVVRTTIFDATHRREYERELMRAHKATEELLRAQSSVAEVLQESLLAGEVPTDARFKVASCYLPAEEGIKVGGDWHDTFFARPGVVGVVVGDVVGRGIEAASAMGQLRSATRALACADLAPGEVLERLERFAEGFPRARMTTLALLILDLASGTTQMACAGHPPPVLIAPGSPAELLWTGRSLPLGVDPTRRREDATLTLAPGTRVVMYTDGLVERRRVTIDARLDELVSATEAVRDAPTDDAVRSVVKSLGGDGGPPDDVCVVCLDFAG